MAKLDAYQLEALNKLKNGSILCGVVGSGKSRVGIAYYIKTCKDKKLYIITTAKKRDTKEWEDELSFFDISQKVVVDSWNNIGKYIDVKNSFFLFDEQRVVGKGVWVKTFIRISRSNRWILLSATPGDTWMDYIPVFIANGFYKNKTEFAREHIVYSRFSKYPKVERYVKGGLLLKHRRDITVNMEYKKKTVQHDKMLYMPFDRTLFKAVCSTRWNPYDNEPIQDAAGLCYILRRVVNSDPGRVEAVRELIRAHPRVIIFYNYNYELALLEELCKSLNVRYAEWNGFRHELIPKCVQWVYLVQYAAGAEGWNCIETDTIIFYSASYSYKAMIQAAGRVDRLNTPYTDLYFYHLTSRSPIDLAIQRSLSGKKNFNESLFVQKEFAEKTRPIIEGESVQLSFL